MYELEHKGRSQNSSIQPVSGPETPALASPGSQIFRKGSSCACGGGCPTCQSKSSDLKISHPNDPAEIEADRVADKVMRMADTGSIRPNPNSENTAPVVNAKSRGGEGLPVGGEIGSRPYSSRGGGSVLDGDTRNFMESRFGVDFSGVRIHTGSEATALSRGFNAKAFTLGSDIYFNEGQYRPDSQYGRHLLAHELTHVVQRGHGEIGRETIHRFADCTSDQDTVITGDHARALQMLDNAIENLRFYDGTTPALVHDKLAEHFGGASSNAFAAWINFNLRRLREAMDTDYKCFSGGAIEKTWACKKPITRATSYWCVPGIDIRLCSPYFGDPDIERSTTLIHEWVHKFGCNFDWGYEGGDEYKSNSTIGQLMNAGPFANLVRDIQSASGSKLIQEVVAPGPAPTYLTTPEPKSAAP